MSDELEALMEWRWADAKGHAMTNWVRGNLPPVLDLTDSKGAMHVETRILDTLGDENEA